MEYFVNLVLVFFTYAFLGWCMEVILKYIQYHRFINRGFFAGPVCPIYGAGAVLITLFVGGVAPLEDAYGTTFAMSFFLCGAVEYATSYFMEKRFHARWWDYSQKPMNLNGRVWIGNLILFGLAGILIIHIINPVLYSAFGNYTLAAREAVAAVFAAIFAVDYVDTHFILKLVKTGVEHSEADSTEEINQEIRELFSDRNLFYRRFAEAYPEVVYRTEKINARLEAIHEETERILKEAEIERERISKALESPAVIRNEIIEKQSLLIDMIYDENKADEEQVSLKREIEADKDRLSENPFVKYSLHVQNLKTEIRH